MKRTQIITGLIALALIASAAPANVNLLNLTDTDGQGEGVTIGKINGAWFIHGYPVRDDLRMNNANATDQFMDISGGNDGIEVGYNTDAQPCPLDAKHAKTKGITLGEVSMRTWSGVDYFEFSLIINQNGSAGGQYLSVNEMKIYTASDSGDNNTTDVSTLGDLQWSLDGDGNNNRVDIDYSLGSTGTNDIDMVSYIPVSLFDGVLESDYVYLYVEMGLDQDQAVLDLNSTDPALVGYAANAGTEQWVLFTTDYAGGSGDVPEPATMGLLALGGIAMLRGRRNRG
jgi:hypothetical protein